jgi:pilus assembly protein CpaC
MPRRSGRTKYLHRVRHLGKGRLLSAVLLAIVTAAFFPFRTAVSEGLSIEEGTPIRHMKVTRFKSKTFQLRTPFASAVVGSPEVADVLPVSDRVLYV